MQMSRDAITQRSFGSKKKGTPRELQKKKKRKKKEKRPRTGEQLGRPRDDLGGPRPRNSVKQLGNEVVVGPNGAVVYLFRYLFLSCVCVCVLLFFSFPIQFSRTFFFFRWISREFAVSTALAPLSLARAIVSS